AAGLAASGHAFLFEPEVLGEAADRRLVVVDEGASVLADEAVLEVAAEAPAAAADVRRVGLVDRRRDSRAAGPEHVRAAEPGQAGADDGDPGARRGTGRLEAHAREDGACSGRLGQQLAARQEPFLPLAGDLVDGHLPPLGFRVRREELAEVAGQRRVRDRAGPAHAAATLTPCAGRLNSYRYSVLVGWRRAEVSAPPARGAVDGSR